MEPDPIKNDARKKARELRLGKDPICLFCGKENPEALMRISRSILENHHIFGKANDPDATVILCRNCHAVETERQAACGVNLTHDKNRPFLETLVSILKDLALAFSAFASRLLKLADELADYLETAEAANSLLGSEG